MRDGVCVPSPTRSAETFEFMNEKLMFSYSFRAKSMLPTALYAGHQTGSSTVVCCIESIVYCNVHGIIKDLF